jgi:hypothetical protein
VECADGEVEVDAFYNVDAIKDGRKIIGARLPRCGHLAKDLKLVIGNQVRADRIPRNAFTGRRADLEIVTVSTTWDGRAKEPSEHYSRVLRIVALRDEESSSR